MAQTLTEAYERLRHSTDSQELSSFAHQELPPQENIAEYSRDTALLEAVAGNPHTPVEDRIFLAQTMPFSNILVKLSQDAEASVRLEVAKNANSKKWLIGRLSQDEDTEVRNLALLNPNASWKVQLDGANDPLTTAETLTRMAERAAANEDPKQQVLADMVQQAALAHLQKLA